MKHGNTVPEELIRLLKLLKPKQKDRVIEYIEAIKDHQDTIIDHTDKNKSHKGKVTDNTDAM